MNDEDRALLKQIAKDVADIKAALRASVGASAAALGVSAAGAAAGGKAGAVATDRELDESHGDPTIKYDPKRWDGQSFVGCAFSQASPEYLDAYAGFKEWSAAKDDESGAKDSRGKPKSFWSWKEARLARGWAKRLRAGWKPKGAPQEEEYDDGGYGGGSEDIPFITNMTLTGEWWRP